MLPLCGRAPVRALFSGHRGERFHGTCVGRPAVLDPVGWGTPPPTSPRAADRSGRRTPPPGLCVAEAVRKACTERVRACPSIADLAENRWLPRRVIRAPTTSVEGAKGVLRERIGGAFASTCRGSGGAGGMDAGAPACWSGRRRPRGRVVGPGAGPASDRGGAGCPGSLPWPRPLSPRPASRPLASHAAPERATTVPWWARSSGRRFNCRTAEGSTGPRGAVRRRIGAGSRVVRG